MASSEKKTRKKTRDSGASAGGKDEPGEDGPFRLLHDLPTELLLACAVFLPPSDLIRLGGCDKYLNEVSKSPVLWVKLLQRPFPWAAADESLGAKIAAVWPELAFLADRSFVETAKILLFAPRSVPSLSASRRRLIDPRSICPHLASPAIAEIPALRELFDNLLGSDFCSKSASKPVCAGPLHGYSADSPVPGFSGAELYTSCPHGPPDLWICLHPDCLSVRCGRTRNAHALMHYASENERNGGHQVAIKVSTLELWCYSCGRWLGVPYSHPLEILRLRSLGLSLLGLPTDPEPGFLSKKVMERGDKAAVLLEWMRNLRRQEERFWSIMWDSANPVGQIYLIGQPFIPHWNKYVLSEFWFPRAR